MTKQIDFQSVGSELKSFYLKNKRLPSFSEIQKLFGYASKGGVLRLVNHLVKKGIVEQDSKGKLVPTAFFEGGVKLLKAKMLVAVLVGKGAVINQNS